MKKSLFFTACLAFFLATNLVNTKAYAADSSTVALADAPAEVKGDTIPTEEWDFQNGDFTQVFHGGNTEYSDYTFSPSLFGTEGYGAIAVTDLEALETRSVNIEIYSASTDEYVGNFPIDDISDHLIKVIFWNLPMDDTYYLKFTGARNTSLTGTVVISDQVVTDQVIID